MQEGFVKLIFVDITKPLKVVDQFQLVVMQQLRMNATIYL